VKNRYISHAHISERKFRRILRLFSLDLNAIQIADLTRTSRNSINRYLTALRERMAWLCEQAAPMGGEVEVDESYFGARRAKGKRGRGEFARGEAHINGIEGFWGYTKARLAKFRGMSKRTFYLHLKECEFRFNHRHEEMYEILLDSCEKLPLKLS